MKVSTTWSLTAMPVTALPMASTMPAASCPSTIGVIATRRSPRITCKSVRQRPTAAMRTSTSVGFGASSSIGSMESGDPTLRKTAAWVNMVLVRDLDAGFLDHLRPRRNLLGEHGSEFRRRVTDDVESLFAHCLSHVRHCQILHRLAVNLVDDIGRRTGRRH